MRPTLACYLKTNPANHHEVITLQLDNASVAQLREWESQLTEQYQAILAKKLNLDLTRGKPSAEQLNLDRKSVV
jgi:hypothetical protein